MTKTLNSKSITCILRVLAKSLLMRLHNLIDFVSQGMAMEALEKRIFQTEQTLAQFVKERHDGKMACA